MMKKKRNQIRALTRMALCAAVLCACSYVVIPLPISPAVVSLHTVAVNLTGLILEPGQAFATVGLYLLMGLVGLPVFSGGTAGPGKLFGPAGGYYFGFLLSAWAISIFKGKKPDSVRYAMVTTLVGVPLEHICAVGMMCIHNGFQVIPAFVTISLPFLLGDIMKCLVSAVCGAAVCRALDRK